VTALAEGRHRAGRSSQIGMISSGRLRLVPQPAQADIPRAAW
jgi:hypothetical protein